MRPYRCDPADLPLHQHVDRRMLGPGISMLSSLESRSLLLPNSLQFKKKACPTCPAPGRHQTPLLVAELVGEEGWQGSWLASPQRVCS